MRAIGHGQRGVHRVADPSDSGDGPKAASVVHHSRITLDGSPVDSQVCPAAGVESRVVLEHMHRRTRGIQRRPSCLQRSERRLVGLRWPIGAIRR